ncbi:MAG: PrsW family intramembrane metalloprotease [Peptococcaceae bacterium]|nr:PrsW family intramembrane metalloprotease [Peptococcaceae bacterium]
MREMFDIFMSFFRNPSVLGIGISILIGIVWLIFYRSPKIKKLKYWMLFFTSGLLGLIGLAFLQYPLNQLLGFFMKSIWTDTELQKNILVVGIFSVLIGGYSQESAKIIPLVINWIFKKKNMSTKEGLIAGAVSGAGFGVFEAQWMLNRLFSAGWTWADVSEKGIIALIPFWERFFAVGGHIAFSALVGYGISKGKGWRFFLLAGLLHATLNYSAFLLRAGLLTFIHVELWVAIFSAGLTIVILTKIKEE